MIIFDIVCKKQSKLASAVHGAEQEENQYKNLNPSKFPDNSFDCNSPMYLDFVTICAMYRMLIMRARNRK